MKGKMKKSFNLNTLSRAINEGDVPNTNPPIATT